ncbi:nuclear transport factor 2 family protein [Nocardioides marmotae]|uniref:nuclear transport factor 2 family protein n=1 Tax=Nocardioides marmotae TaxID=2663857 RepID=UPI0012B62912|nr:nuclear transport factor 2 family protein [Nocardioides marmotae]MBC9734893.1 nuclear transport factor 2 family protein [Nocardioides marmotae]MTB85994.1 steroid delta-isomerase [Nocardioides marmotae]
MPASNEAVRAVVERYVALVATGTADQIVDLYADGATVEDPVGSEPLTTREAIHAFYATLEGLEKETRLLDARVVAGEAVFAFEVRTKAGDQTYVLAPFDVMTFDEDARITSMRAYWGEADMRLA